jgi:hypothetical protein
MELFISDNNEMTWKNSFPHPHYSVKKNLVFLVVAIIKKTIAYSFMNKIQLCKHESTITQEFWLV